MKTIYYAATSMDGFIATKNHQLEFLDRQPQITEDTYDPFIANVGAICMGASTYRFISDYVEKGNPWPYQQPTWVFSHREQAPVEGADLRFVSSELEAVFEAMKTAAGGKDIWICGGGELAGQFLDAGLLDELILTVASSTLGEGQPLLPRAADWKLTSARGLGAGFAELRYEPA